MVTGTPEQQQAALKLVADFQKALLPARLADIPSNGVIVAAELNKRGWSYTVQNLVRVVNEILFSDLLTWTVEPEKLKAHKRLIASNNVNVEVLTNPRKDAEDLFQRKAAAEAADAKAKADAKTFERIDAAINNLYLRRLSETADQKARLFRYVAQEKARNAIPETIFEQIKKEIERLYKEEARIAERM
jgi:hypothetical protein